MRQYNWFTSLVMLFLINGCAMQVSTTPSVSSTQTSVSQTATPIAIPISTLTPSVNILQPTLSAEETKNKVFGLLKNNGNCLMPCLWGLTPGKIGGQTFDDFISQFGELVTPDDFISVREHVDSGGLTLIHRENNIHINVNFGYLEDKDNKLIMFGLSGYAMKEIGKDLDWKSSNLTPVYGDASFNQVFGYYLLPQILSNYGRPSQVLLKPFVDDPQRPDIKWWPFSLVLLYPEQGIFVEYVSHREDTGDNYMSCPSKSTISLAVWDPQSDLSLEYIIQRAGSQINESTMDYFKSVDEATSMTLDEFYQTFKDPENDLCLETPQALWQP